MSDTEALINENLGPRLLERLYYGAMKLEGTSKHTEVERRLQAAFVIISALLTMRAASIQHLREAWIDWERGEILVPETDVCACKRCWEEAVNKWLRDGYKELDGDEDEDSIWDEYEEVSGFDDLTKDHKQLIIEESSITKEDLLEYVYEQYQPKTESSVRRIPFGFSCRATAVYKAFFNKYDYFEFTQEHMRNLLNDAAEEAPGLAADAIFTHKLRGEGITMFARLFPKNTFVRDIAGHQDLRVTNDYVSQLGRITTYQAYAAAGKKDEAPPVIPENKEAKFPILLDPHQFIGEPWNPKNDGDKDSRQEYADEKREQKSTIQHPRGLDVPNLAGMPEDMEREYSIDDHLDNLPVDLSEIDTMDIKYSKNTTLSGQFSPHDLNDTGETEQYRYDRSDDESPVNNNQVNSSTGLGFMINSIMMIFSVASAASERHISADIGRTVRVCAAQITEGISNYLDPKHRATIGRSEISKFFLFVFGVSMLPVGVERSTVLTLDAWLMICIAFVVPLIWYPWKDIRLSNALPVSER